MKSLVVYYSRYGSSPEQAFKEMSELAGQVPRAEMSVRAQTIEDGTFIADLPNFIGKLNLQEAA